MKRVLAAITTGATLLCQLAWGNQDNRPNIVFIMADDVGYSDLSSYGGEIATPNIDSLALQGTRFSNYYTAASCAPSRAMALTGVDSHRAGVANISEATSSEQAKSPFYQAALRPQAITIAERLKANGYRTMLAGKWHLGNKQSQRPFYRGFEQTLMMPHSGGDNYDHKSYLPMYSYTPWYRNGEEITLPEDFYSSKALVDETIKQIESTNDSGKPFFSYLSFLAVHIPVQAPPEHTNKYIDTYNEGFEVLRQRRFEGVKKQGLVPDTVQIKFEQHQTWADLSAQEKRHDAKKMAVYAGMIDAMDMHIGRLISYLKDTGQYDNTIFVFTSDNGAEGNDPYTTPGWPLVRASIGYDEQYDTLGEKNSWTYIGSSFANAAAAPFGEFKMHSGEGGIRVPLIISGPVASSIGDNVGTTNRGGITHGRAFVKDIAPTLLELANIDTTLTKPSMDDAEPITGRSLVKLVTGQQHQIYDDSEYIAYEIGGNAALLKGDYKIQRNQTEYFKNEWRLFNITQDPGETTPIESTHPNVFQDLLNDYTEYKRDNGVIDVSPHYTQMRQVSINATISIIKRPSTIIVLGILIAIVVMLIRSLVRRFRSQK